MKPIRVSSRVPAPVRAASRARAHTGTVRELHRALVDGGRWWMVPMIGVLGAAALLLAVVAAVEYVAPFVYTIF